MGQDQRSSVTYAGNPGRVELNGMRWLFYHPLWPSVLAAGLVLCLVLARDVHWAFWVPTVLLVVVNLLYWVIVREQFIQGNLNPGVVVGLKPLRIAVSTDLTKGKDKGSYPAVKIIQPFLLAIQGERPRMGMRVATIAYYAEGKDKSLPHWVDFHPTPAEHATGNPVVLAQTLARIPEEDWRELDAALAHVPQPYRPGLYMVPPAS